MDVKASETIIAQSTPQAVSAIHIIRVAGPLARAFLLHHTRLGNIKPRRVYVTAFWVNSIPVDNIVCFFFKAPHSYTGEDMVELHCHGSPLIAKQILAAGAAFGLAPAAPGEFTKRAFLNGKMSIEQAQAVDALIRSKHEYLKQNALNILEKKASLKFDTIHRSLLELMAYLESAIEFPEEDIRELQSTKKRLYETFLQKFSEITTYLERLVANFDRGKKLDEGIKVVIAGRPNAGKSTLMNALLKEERVLVSEVRGTTRDFVREQMEINGIPIYLYDTAGLRKTSNEIEKAGITKTYSLIDEADILLFLSEDKRGCEHWITLRERMDEKPFLSYLTKKDLATANKNELKAFAKKSGFSQTRWVTLNKETDILSIEEDLKHCLAQHYSYDHEQISLLNLRQRKLVIELQKCLEKTGEMLRAQETEEIIVEEIKALNDVLAELNLSVEHEEVFDTLFSSFCIGK